MSRTHSVLGGFSWSLLNSLSQFIYGFVISALIARILGPTTYGDYTYLIWLYTVVSLIGTLGAGQTLTKYMAEWSLQGHLGWAASLLRRFIALQVLTIVALSSLLWGLLQFFPWLLGKSLSADTLLIALAIAVPLTLNGTLSASLQGLQRFKHVAMAGACGVLLSLLLVGIALLLKPNITTFLSITLATQLLLVTLYLWFLRNIIFTPGRLNRRHSRPIFTYALGIYIIAFIDLVVWQRSEVYFLGRFAPSKEIAFYNLAFGLINTTIFLVVTAFNSVLVPVFTRLFHEDAQALRQGYYRATKLAGLFVFPAAVGLAMLAPAVVKIIYGEGFMPMSPLVGVLAISVAISATAGAGSALVYSQGKHWFSVKIGLPLAVLNIGLDLWLIPRYFAWGAAWANTLTQIVGIMAGTIFVVTVFKVVIPIRSLLTSLAAALLMAVVLEALHWLPLPDVVYILIAIPLGTIIYLVLVLKMKVLDATDISMLWSVEEKLSGKTKYFARRLVGGIERFSGVE